MNDATHKIGRAALIRMVERMGGTVAIENAGRWRVLQLEAPAGKLWSEGLKAIRVEWPTADPSHIACSDAARRIAGQTFIPIPPELESFYEEEGTE